MGAGHLIETFMSLSKDRLYYGWVIVIVLFITGVVIVGSRLSFGVFFKPIENEFNLSRAATSLIPSIYMLLSGIFGFFSGWALDKYGPRLVLFLMGLVTGASLLLTARASSLWQLFVSYGLLQAIGTGGVFVVPASIISRWFYQKRGLALGIATTSSGLGTVITVPFATYLIARYDWRVAYLILGLIVLVVVIPLSKLLRKDPQATGYLSNNVKVSPIEHGMYQEQKNKLEVPRTSSPALLKVSKTRSFWCFMFIHIFYAFCMLLILTHLVPYITDMHFSAVDAAAVVTVLGGVSIIGRVLMGIVSDRVGRKLSLIICTLLEAGSLVFLIWASNLWTLYLFGIVFGFAYGGFVSSMGALVGYSFELGKIGAIFGMLEIGFGIGAAAGPIVGGVIYDTSGSYFAAFIIGAVAMLLAALLVPPIRRERVGMSYPGKYDLPQKTVAP